MTDHDYRRPRQSRSEFVDSELDRLRTAMEANGNGEDPPEVAERKKRERAANLAAQDERWGVTPGCTIRWSVGDADGKDD